MKRNIYLIESMTTVGYDCYEAHIVIALSTKSARQMCPFADEGESFWLDSKQSKISKIGETTKEPKVVLSAFHSG